MRGGKVIHKVSLMVLVLSVGSVSQAAKYMVSFKSKREFGQMHTQYVLRSNMNLAQVLGGTQVTQAEVSVHESLENLDSMIVDTEDPAALAALESSGAVQFIEPEIFHPAPQPMSGFQKWTPWDVSLHQPMDVNPTETTQVGPKTPWGIKTVRAPEAWSQARYGQGARVLILDTGLDVNHPALKDNFEKGMDFAGTGGSDITDEVGHGTHVAGTVLGVLMTDGFTGVAPKAKLLAGRVCVAEGCSNLAVAQGINWGIREKVDVISMSLGGPIGSMSEKKAVEAAEAAGVVVVAATGNDGTGKISFPAAFATSIAVGAIDSGLKRAAFSQYGPELDIVAPGVSVISSVPQGSGRESSVKLQIGNGSSQQVKSSTFVGTVEVPTPMTNELVYSGLGHPTDFKPTVKGKFALIARGEIAFADKAKNAIAAGAAGVVIYNNAPGLLQGAVSTDGTLLPVPVMMIEQTSGETVKKQLDAGVIAKATIQTLATDYSAFDGTSMATPHVAGVVALIKAANPRLTPAQVRTVLSSSANSSVGPTTEYGAGLVNAEAAVRKALEM